MEIMIEFSEISSERRVRVSFISDVSLLSVELADWLSFENSTELLENAIANHAIYSEAEREQCLLTLKRVSSLEVKMLNLAKAYVNLKIIEENDSITFFTLDFKAIIEMLRTALEIYFQREWIFSIEPEPSASFCEEDFLLFLELSEEEAGVLSLSFLNKCLVDISKSNAFNKYKEYVQFLCSLKKRGASVEMLLERSIDSFGNRSLIKFRSFAEAFCEFARMVEFLTGSQSNTKLADFILSLAQVQEQLRKSGGLLK